MNMERIQPRSHTRPQNKEPAYRPTLRHQHHNPLSQTYLITLHPISYPIPPQSCTISHQSRTNPQEKPPFVQSNSPEPHSRKRSAHPTTTRQLPISRNDPGKIPQLAAPVPA